MDDEHEWVFHSIPIEELCVSLDTNLKTGLSSSQAAEGNDLHGLNFLTPPPTKPHWIALCGSIFGGSSLPLWLGAAPCFVAYGTGFGIGNLIVGASLSSIATVSGIISYYQKCKASKVVDIMKNRLRPLVLCLRDGEKKRIWAQELTLGDIVYVKQGDMVPADIRILESNDLRVDNSSLTGESEPQTRSSECTHDNLLETKNLAFYSTSVVNGSGVGLVVNIGDETVMGQIANRSSALSSQTSGIDRFIFRLNSLTVCVGAGLCAAAYFNNFSWLYPAVVGLNLIPSAIYRSINAGIHSAFYTMGVYDCYVKDQNSLETLGAISCLCTTKTGTVTQNRMTVSQVLVDNKIEDFPAYDGGNTWPVKEKPSWKILERAAMLCNSAEFSSGWEYEQIYRRSCYGNETDAAILKVTAGTTDDNVMEYRAKHKKVCEKPFSAYKKFQLTIHEIKETGDGDYVVVVKGAPERILDFSSTSLIDGKDSSIDKSDVEATINKFGDMGMKVIGFCDLILSQDEYENNWRDAYDGDWPMQGFRFLGLMAMIDSPRAAVPDTIAKLRGQHGIKIVMLTGDHPHVAKAMAKAVGIISEGNETVQDMAERLGVPVEEVNPRDARAAVVHGDDAKNMSTDDLHEILRNHTEVVFARVTPQMKLVIVEALHGLKELVGLVGNESTILRRADVSIAMGISGSEQAKNAADIILMEDNYACIERGVSESKYMFRSLRKYRVLPQYTCQL